jgi:hypothetical protein
MARSALEQLGQAVPLEIVALPSLQPGFPVGGPRNNLGHDRRELLSSEFPPLQRSDAGQPAVASSLRMSTDG